MYPLKFSAALLFTICCIALHAQHLTFPEWVSKAPLDLRLQPRYGDGHKNAEQKASDAEFVRLVLLADSVPRSASDQLVKHGFDLLRKGDHTSAMYRFNQAFLLDSTNADIYWGYGTFFMELDRPVMAHTMYRAGLSLDSTNTDLLVGEATAYLAEYHMIARTDSVYARELVQKAQRVLRSAVRQDPSNVPALQRMVICHVHLGECKEAKDAFLRYEKAAGVTGDTVLVGDLLMHCRQRQVDRSP